MNDAISTLRAWWDGRTVRERRMLMAMIALFAVTFVWLLILRPAWGWHADAADRLTTARAEQAEVRSSLRAFAPAATPRQPNAEGLEPVARRTAEGAGLTVTFGMDPAGGLGFRASSVSSAAIFGWLAVLEAEHGIRVRSLGVAENADASLNVEGALEG